MSTSQPSTAAAEVQDTNFSGTRQHYGSTQSSTPTAPKPTTASSRVIAPDLLRGLILPLMSLDHAALFMGAWLHGTPKQTESAGTPMTQWNFNSAYISRTITHLCAPGFFFLMGMGTVYFHRSRARLGWGKARMAKHFAVRAVALTLVSEVMGESLMWGRHILVINIVLIGLAVDYLLCGLLCLALDSSETVTARWMERLDGRKGDSSTPLLRGEDGHVAEEQRGSHGSSARSQSMSFWLHNLLLVTLTYITIFWNVWLSPTHGHCPSTSVHPTITTTSSTVPIELLALTSNTSTNPSPIPAISGRSAWIDFWFLPVQNQYVMSGFPPLAWISFCLFGMLYARIMLHHRWSASIVIMGNLSIAILLSVLFVATRLFHFGNLSEACLYMPEHLSHPGRNQYLASVKSFFYVTKYPPSPSFFAFTMAINFGLLALFSAIPPTVAIKIPGLMNFGGSALFFYVAHMYLYSLLSIPARYFFEHDLPDKPPNEWERTKGLGASAPFWIIWVLGLFILNPMCKAYGRFKSAQSTDSLWRFF